MKLQRPRADSALSLIELLVVIAIIAVLAALLLLSVSQGKTRAQSVVCVNNVRELGQAMQSFVSAKRAYPLEVNPRTATVGSNPDHGFSWIESLGKELGQDIKGRNLKGIWICPAAAKKPGDADDQSGPYSCYGYNANGLAALTDTNSLGLGGHFVRHYPSRPPAPAVAETEVATPSDMIGIGDGFMGNAGNYFDGAAWIARMSPPQTNPVSTAAVKTRHQGKANVVFCDGHVESPKLKSLFEDTSDAALVRWNRDHLPHREELSP
ncbi:MAG: prepilin-type N-terminal cleavage/methylation domain-containing protein [Verrucomicrobiae bacterium]|nr:prepilin-type N-terminal cleavage/methylation domain-containing protein [Verrucomicrobiae bacterium]